MLQEEKQSTDPLELSGLPKWGVVGSLAARILGVFTLMLYSIWAVKLVWNNMASLYEAEMQALDHFTAIVTGGGMPAMAAVAGPGVVIAGCILAALYLTFVATKWVKQIVREWKWVWRHLTSGSGWDKLWGVLGLVLVLCETIVWVAITVVSVVLVYINVKALVPGL